MEAELCVSLGKFPIQGLLFIDPVQQLAVLQFLTVALEVQLFKDKESQVHNIKSLFS